MGTEATSIALKAAAAAMKLADEKKPIEMEITGPTEEIAKTMGGKQWGAHSKGIT